MRASEVGRVLRRHLIAGMIVIAPLGVTVFVLTWIFEWLDGLLGRYLYAGIGRPVPGLGLAVLLLLLVLVGWATQRAVGARVLGWWHVLLERIPLTRNIYSASSRIVKAVVGDSGARPFQSVVLVQFPSQGRWSIGFVTGAAPPGAERVLPDAVTVFVPTTPNPTTGFLITVPRGEVVPLAMTTEQAFTYVLSAGHVAPETAALGRTEPVG